MSLDIKGLLGRLGLKDREGKVYLACLRNREGLFIYEIAKATRLPRSTADLLVRRLVRRGFLHKSKEGRRLLFVAQDPEGLLFRQKQLVEDMEQMLPVLTRLGGSKKEMEIHFFEGALGYKQAYEEMLRVMKSAPEGKRDLLSFSSGADALRLFPDMPRAFIAKRVKMGAWYKAIAPRDSQALPEWRDSPEEKRAVKFMPAGQNAFRMDIFFCHNTVALYSTTAPLGGVVIHNEKVADSMRTLFSVLWGALA